jgi:hypothetical protein
MGLIECQTLELCSCGVHMGTYLPMNDDRLFCDWCALPVNTDTDPYTECSEGAD